MSRPSDLPDPTPPTPTGSADFELVGEAIDLSDDVYARIIEQVRSAESNLALLQNDLPLTEATARVSVAPPAAPQSLEEAGLSLMLLGDLVLKQLYLNGSLTAFEMTRQLKLPFSLIERALDFLKSERTIEVSSGTSMGKLSYRFVLTDGGRTRARDAFAACRYVGPAPVSLEQYTQQCRIQSVRQASVSYAELQRALSNLVLDEGLPARLGPAVQSGQAIFLHGPSGNGKTVIARALGRLLHECIGGIFVPYAMTVDQQIIAVFDPTLHRVCPLPEHDDEKSSASAGSDASASNADERADASEAGDAIPAGPRSSQSDVELDGRWRFVRRPVVITAGELSLDQLELRYHESSGYYSAPVHMKANGGVFVIDDFGRQLVPPRELLNRWILPLEERTDFLCLATGKKFAVPFEPLTIFSTNLDPAELVDEAFLRRIRHKIAILPPSDGQFREIFKQECTRRGIDYDDWIVSRLLETQYNPQSPPKCCDPRDLLDVLESICRFHGEKPHLSEKLIFDAFRDCLGDPRLTSSS